MSDMEVFYGIFEKSDLKVETEYTDNFYAMEEEHHCHFVKVNGQLYKFWAIDDIEPHGFMLIIPPSTETRFIAYWYNGGANVYEVVGDLIKNHVKAGR